MTSGLRPSSVSLEQTPGTPIDLRVIVAEYLGAESVLVTRCGTEDVLVEANSATPIACGTMRSFGVLTDELMDFDRTSGLRI
ncbi:multiple sugar transport system ATP-binding protein [Jannaschia faecimaris]|uniref:Multiple sugar transport system ATP-binding protein n=1 Tax=Jannaschia faecimaris TaxID=1244108 RepID=A0A1H3TIF8_9RHOB|nr:TOBE domain-containing protein [Jannaschia faecimaris]SDZ49900.1 multiple sugar transport system ATP-binding protein [Jannaschia faecimaris]